MKKTSDLPHLLCIVFTLGEISTTANYYHSKEGGGGCLQNGAKLCRCNENPPISAGTNTGILQQSGMDQWAMEQGQNTISDRAIWKRHVEI